MVGARKNIYIIPVIVFGGPRKKMVDRFLFFFGWGIFWQEKSWEKKYVKNIHSVYFHLPLPFKRKKLSPE